MAVCYLHAVSGWRQRSESCHTRWPPGAARAHTVSTFCVGLPRLMKSPEDKTLGYTVVVVIATIFVDASSGSVRGNHHRRWNATSRALGGLTSRVAPSSETTHPPGQDSPLGKLEELGKKLEESNKKMEAAERKAIRRLNRRGSRGTWSPAGWRQESRSARDRSTERRSCPSSSPVSRRSAQREKNGFCRHSWSAKS